MTSTWLSRAKTSKAAQRLSQWQIDTGETTSGSKWDAILGAFLMVRIGMPGFNFYVGDVAALLLVIVSLRRKSNVPANRVKIYVTFASLVLFYLGFESFYNDVNFLNRLLKLTILFALAASITFGRLSLPKVVLGLLLGLIANVPLYYLNLTPDSGYVGCLTGFLGDKNVAGLYYAIVPLLASAFVAKRSTRAVLLAFGAACTFLTLSRSSLAAFAFGLAWLMVSKKSGLGTKIILGAATVFLYQYLEATFSQAGIFADRVGSDLLRARIDNAAASLADGVPWYGKGLSTAVVDVGNHPFFLHNSYLSLYIEGGWFFVISILAPLFFVVFRPLRRPPFSFTQITQQAALLAVLLCALRLGEVFLTVPVAILIGSALRFEAIFDGKVHHS